MALDNGRDDIISGLPQNLIESILDRLPVRDAARTSVLSKKWRYIWSAHPHLVFDKQFQQEVYEYNTRNDLAMFANELVSIINQILLLHSGPIQRFSFSIPDHPYNWNLHVDHWLLFLSRNGIKELILLVHLHHTPYKLPSYIYSCQELTHLQLRNCTFRPPDSFDGFRNLISLRLLNISFAANVFRTLLPSAPLLETLKFSHCTGVEHFNIHAPKLKKFIVGGCSDVKSIRFDGTPNLNFLSISLGTTAENRGQGRTNNFCNFFVNLAGICTLHSLRFDGFFLKLLDAATVPGRLSITFNHLKHLTICKLRFDDLDQMTCVLCLLTSSPNLKKLVMTLRSLKKMRVCAVRGDRVEPDLSYLEAPDCMDQMRNQLQTVSITSMNGSRAELPFIKRILSCSPLLETMFVPYKETVGIDEGFEISTELMRFSRASPKAEIVFVD